MLKSHMDAVENHLLATSRIPANSGHSLHKGTPRESFISEFLRGHLSEKVSIGTGEIIDANSQPGEVRNQYDIVVYKREFPKLTFGGGINGFLAESVVATIEVKSNLTKADFRTSMLAAKNAKNLQRNLGGGMHAGYQPPSILSFLIAYDGPAIMNTIHGWINPFMASEGIVNPQMGNTLDTRTGVIAPCLDGLFILGRGFINYDNCPLSLISDTARAANPQMRWAVSSATTGSLLMLFLILTNAVSGVSVAPFNALPYVNTVRWNSTPQP